MADHPEVQNDTDFGDIVNFRDDGILWMLNRTVFHPRGFALGIDTDNSELTLMGDGLEPWRFAESLNDKEDELFRSFEAMLERRRENAQAMKEHKAAAIRAEQEQDATQP